MIKIYTDGASRGNPGPSGAGALIIRNEEEIFEVCQFLGTQTNNYAEYTALLEALKKLVELVPKSDLEREEILCLADSELMVKQLNGEYKVKHPGLIPIHLEIKKMIKGLSIKFKHIPRDDNKRADLLSNMAIDGADLAEK